jgi:hypothetical protein
VFYVATVVKEYGSDEGRAKLIQGFVESWANAAQDQLIALSQEQYAKDYEKRLIEHLRREANFDPSTLDRSKYEGRQ